MTALTTFDQSQLPEDVQALLHGAAERIRVRLKRTAEDIIEIGHDLLLVKDRLEHGQFGEWLQQEFEFSHSSALKFMRVAERFGKIAQSANLKPAILYALSAPSTSDEVREAALKLAEAGETVTLADVQALKQQLQQAEQTRDQLIQRVEKAESRNEALDLNLAAASEREQRSYRELVDTQNKIADLAKIQADAAIEHARKEVEAGQQMIDALKSELEQRQREQRNAIRQGIQAGLTERETELKKLEHAVQQAEAQLQDYRQRLKQRTGDEHENQRLHIDAEKALRELMVLGTTINMFEAPSIYDVNQTLLERLKQCAAAVIPLIEQFQQKHGHEERTVNPA